MPLECGVACDQWRFRTAGLLCRPARRVRLRALRDLRRHDFVAFVLKNGTAAGPGNGTDGRALDPAMYRCDDADEKVEHHRIAVLKAVRKGLSTHACDAHRAVRFVGERVMQVVRQLAVDADWLHPMQDGLAGSFEH
jgi:hypothetical protein